MESVLWPVTLAASITFNPISYVFGRNHVDGILPLVAIIASHKSTRTYGLPVIERQDFLALGFAR
jgi:hypothetical protein